MYKYAKKRVRFLVDFNIFINDAENKYTGRFVYQKLHKHTRQLHECRVTYKEEKVTHVQYLYSKTNALAQQQKLTQQFASIFLSYDN